MITQAAANLQSTPGKGGSTVAQSDPGTSGFGDALAKATAVVTHAAKSAPAENHTLKKPSEKKTDSEPAQSARRQKTTQGSDVQPTVPANMKVDATTVPLPPAALAEKTATEEPTDSEKLAGTADRVAGSAFPTPGGTSQRTSAVGSTDHVVRPQEATAASASSVNAGAKQSEGAHQQAASRPASTKGDGVQGQDSDEQVGPANEVSATATPGEADSRSEGDAQAATESDLEAAAMLGVALPTTTPAILDAGTSESLLTGANTSGSDLSVSGLPAVANGGTRSDAAGASSAALKSKGVNSGGDPATPSATVPLQKVADTVQAAASASGGAGTNANGASAQANAQSGLTAAGASQVDAKATPHSSGDPVAERTGATASAPQSWDASATQVVHRAQLIQAMHQTEMRMGMNSAEFGDISISAAVSHQTLSAQISLDHPELSRALTAQLPEIEKKLGSAYGLPSRVEVRDGSSSGQQGSSRRDGDRSQGGGAQGISNILQTGLTPAQMARESASGTTYSPAAGMRLDILI